MKISACRVIVCSPGRNFVTLMIETDEGVHGIGDATLNGRELSVAAYLKEHVAPALIGRDPARIEDIWQYLYRGAYWRRGPVTMAAIAAVDVALWDTKAKAAGLPLYQLLGGASRTGIMAYGHARTGARLCLSGAGVAPACFGTLEPGEAGTVNLSWSGRRDLAVYDTVSLRTAGGSVIGRGRLVHRTG